MQTGTIYKADGSMLRVMPLKGGKLSLAELQSAVGGNIELVRMAEGNGHGKMFINEDGRRFNLPFNARASALLHPNYKAVVLGDAIVTGLYRARGKRRANTKRLGSAAAQTKYESHHPGRGRVARVLPPGRRNHG